MALRHLPGLNTANSALVDEQERSPASTKQATASTSESDGPSASARLDHAVADVRAG